jgi:hypothetical protein
MSIEKLESPISRQPFIWFAKSYDGTLLTEFENSGKENLFDSIDKVNLKEFGLLGRGAKLWYSSEDGVINIDSEFSNRKIEFYLEDQKQNLIKISGRKFEKYNDIIQFKAFHQDFHVNTKNAMGGLVIDAFLFGYKKVITIPDEGDIHFQFLFNLQMGKPMKLGFRFAPTFYLNHKLFVRIDGQQDVEPIEIKVLADRSEAYEKDFF